MGGRTRAETSSARVRAKLDHPVIDGDAHWLEPVPVFLDFLRDLAGPKAVKRFGEMAGGFLGAWYQMSPQERMARRVMRSPCWVEAGNTLDRATAMIPALLRDRLDDFGVDFAIIYPTMGGFGVLLPDEEMRRAIARAENMMAAEMFYPYRDRMTPAAIVGMWSPQEAIEEAEFAVKKLGMKVIMTAGNIRRPIPALLRDGVDAMTVPFYIDSLGLDSPFDYDPFWGKCLELKVAVTDHGGSYGWPDRQSPTNFVYNHIGHFANAHHAFCRALVMGGVPHRFPDLKFCFLEGGVGWGCNLYLDLVGHWEKRNKEAMLKNLRPANLDLREFAALFDQYADPLLKGKYDQLLESLSPSYPFTSLTELSEREPEIDEFKQSGIRNAHDIRSIFEDSFYFGCEADDRTTAWAFDPKADARLNPIFSSDVGHFDVTDMSEVLEEAYELVEQELIAEDDFRKFVFSNSAKLHAALNPDFFKGTVVEEAVSKLPAP